jgi:hypothetical protein
LTLSEPPGGAAMLEDRSGAALSSRCSPLCAGSRTAIELVSVIVDATLDCAALAVSARVKNARISE